MKRILIALLVLFGLNQTDSCLAAGFYLSSVSAWTTTERYRQVSGTQMVNIYDDEGQIIGQREEATYEPVVETETITKYVLTFIPNGAIKVGEYLGQDIVYCVGRQDPGAGNYLGNSYAEIAKNAWEEMLYSYWYGPDLGAGPVYTRGSMQMWKDAGKPKKLISWQLRGGFFGVSQPIPTAGQLLDLETWVGQMPP